MTKGKAPDLEAMALEMIGSTPEGLEPVVMFKDEHGDIYRSGTDFNVAKQLGQFQVAYQEDPLRDIGYSGSVAFWELEDYVVSHKELFRFLIERDDAKPIGNVND